MQNITFLTNDADINWFFSTIVTASTAVAIMIITFAISKISTINDNIPNRKDKIEKQEIEIHKLKQKNDKLLLILNPELITENEEKYRRLSEIIINNYVRVDQIEQKIKINKKTINNYIEIKEKCNKLLRNIIIFSIIYIIIPLFFISFPINENNMLNLVKIFLIISFILVIIKIIKEFNSILNFPIFQD